MGNDQAYNITGVVGTAIGIFCGVAVPLWLWLIYCRLPRSKIQFLECILSETEKLLTAAVKDGYIDDDESIRRFHKRLYKYVFSVPYCTIVLTYIRQRQKSGEHDTCRSPQHAYYLAGYKEMVERVVPQHVEYVWRVAGSPDCNLCKRHAFTQLGRVRHLRTHSGKMFQYKRRLRRRRHCPV